MRVGHDRRNNYYPRAHVQSTHTSLELSTKQSCRTSSNTLDIRTRTDTDLRIRIRLQDTSALSTGVPLRTPSMETGFTMVVAISTGFLSSPNIRSIREYLYMTR